MPIIQNKEGSRLFDVCDTGKTQLNDKNYRGPTGRDALRLHTDPGDILGMLCVRSANAGGYTTLSSTIAIYNEIYQKSPEAIKTLCEPFYSDRRSNERTGDQPYSDNPIFAFRNNQLMCQYVRLYIEDAQKKFPKVPRLTQKQIEALNLFDEVSTRKDMMFELTLEPGDLILINNNKVLHGRTAYEDSGEQSRHLLRIWLHNTNISSMPNLFGYPNS